MCLKDAARLTRLTTQVGGGGGAGKRGPVPSSVGGRRGDGDARTGAVSADEAMKLGLGLGLSGALGGSGPERRTRFGPRPSPPAAASGGASARCASGCGPGPSGPSGPSGPNAPAAHADATVEGVRVRVSRIHSRPGPRPKIPQTLSPFLLTKDVSSSPLTKGEPCQALEIEPPSCQLQPLAQLVAARALVDACWYCKPRVLSVATHIQRSIKAWGRCLAGPEK